MDLEGRGVLSQWWGGNGFEQGHTHTYIHIHSTHRGKEAKDVTNKMPNIEINKYNFCGLIYEQKIENVDFALFCLISIKMFEKFEIA